MLYRTKYRLWSTILAVAGLGAVYGLWRMFSAALAQQRPPLVGVILLFGGVSLGFAAAITTAYYRSRQKHDRHYDKIALETLARIGAQKRTNHR